MDENLANSEREAFESQAPGLYTGSGRGEQKKGRVKGILKKRGPMLFITGLLAGVGGMMMGAQTLMPVAIEEMIIEKFNSIGISSTLASDSWLNTQLNQGFQDGENNLYGFSEYQTKSFENQGIKVVDVNGTAVLLYLKDGTYVPVVGSNYLNDQSLVGKIRSASGLSNIGTPVSATTALADADFKMPYTTAAKGWRGGASGWFDKIMANVTETKLSIDRNRWARYVASGVSGMTDDFKKAAESAVKTKTSDFVIENVHEVGVDEGDAYEVGGTYTSNETDSQVLTITSKTPIYDVDDGGNEILVGYTIKSSNQDTSTNGVTDSTLARTLNSKAVKVASAAADATCAIVEGMMSIYTVVSAYQSLQFLNLISGYLEAVDKVKARDSNSSPVHTYSNNLTTPADTVSVKADSTASETSMGGTTTEVVATKTAMESQGIAWLFGSNNKIDPNDTSVQNTNLETIMSNISSLTSNVSLTAATFETCGYVKIATSTVSLVSTVLSFIPIFGGAVKLVDITAKAVVKVAIKTAITFAFYTMIPVIAKKVANSLIKDAATEWFGEDLGNAMISGAGKYLGGNGTSGGQSPGSEEKVLAYLQERDVVIAEEAEYQRSIRDPFDVSSQYTFLGSLVYSMVPMAYSNSGVISAIKGVSSLTTSSIVALSPAASAIDKDSMLRSEGDCVLAENIGVVSDVFCNAYIITDTSTINTSPIAVAEIVHRVGDDEIATASGHVGISDNNFNDDGSIKKNSNLAKYITYCGQRTSQYGVKDAAIAERISGGGGGLLNYVPVLGDASSIVSSISDVANMKWTTGEACVASDDNTMWEENKWYQRYAENERLLENINPGYKSTVTAYLEDYYLENPVDNSFEGQIARFSGMSKDDVVDTLALILYCDYIANYNPGERYAFGGDAVKADSSEAILFVDENEENFYNVWWYNNIYDRVGRAETRAKKAEYTIC